MSSSSSSASASISSSSCRNVTMSSFLPSFLLLLLLVVIQQQQQYQVAALQQVSSSSSSSVSASLAPIVNFASATKRIVTTASETFSMPSTPLSITKTTDKILQLEQQQSYHDGTTSESNNNNNNNNNDNKSKKETEEESTLESRLTLFLLKSSRSLQLNNLLKEDRNQYIETATFLSSQIPREELPNVQGIPHPQTGGMVAVAPPPQQLASSEQQQQQMVLELDYLGRELVPDCTVPNTTMGENLLDALLLEITRNIYAYETGVQRRKDVQGITGLIEEMREYMLSEEGINPQKQQQKLVKTLYGLMTPVLPPFYRIFMGWKVPSTEAGDPQWLVDVATEKLQLEEGKNYGPAPYAPLLTSIVAPLVFGFLVGPARINLRSDGAYGGLVVNKCKFLQESNCKGMCLHSCKSPAEQLFTELGLPLRVSPNFDSQECQWSWGEEPLDVKDDPTWPEGCLNGCGTRKEVAKIRKDKNKKNAELASCY